MYFLPLETWDPSRRKYRKKKKQNICRKENNRWRLGRGTLNTCAKIQGLSLENGGHWTLKELGAISLSQPVSGKAHPAGVLASPIPCCGVMICCVKWLIVIPSRRYRLPRWEVTRSFCRMTSGRGKYKKNVSHLLNINSPTSWCASFRGRQVPDLHDLAQSAWSVLSVLSSTHFLGWMCTLQILHKLSQWQMSNYFEVDFTIGRKISTK